jgi:nucleoside phosphorylase
MENDFLICGAFEGEVDLVLNQFPNHTFITGVGVIDASIRLTKRLLESKPNFIIQMGSCGNLFGNQVGTIIQSNEFRLWETGMKENRIHIPSLMNQYIKTEFEHSSYFQMNHAISYTSLGVSLELPSGFDISAVETMESFGLARVASLHSVPFLSILGVTNQVGPNGSEEWKKNWRDLSHKVQSLVLESINAISRNSSA